MYYIKCWHELFRSCTKKALSVGDQSQYVAGSFNTTAKQYLEIAAEINIEITAGINDHLSRNLSSGINNLIKYIAKMVTGTSEPATSQTTDSSSPHYNSASPKTLPELLGVALDIHSYFFTTGFGILALLSMILLGKLIVTWRRGGGGSSVPYLTTLTLQTLVLGIGRVVYLGVDAYNLRGKFHVAVGTVLFGIHTATLTSAFLLLFVALLKLTQMRLVRHGLMKWWVIVTIVLTNYVVWIVGDTLTALYENWRPVPYLCDAYYIAWGYSYFGLFVYVFHSFYKASTLNQKSLHQMENRSSRSSASNSSETSTGNSSEQNAHSNEAGPGRVTGRRAPPPGGNRKRKMPLAMKLSLVISLMFFFTASVHVFVSMNRFYLPHLGTDPWLWLAINVTWCTIQLLMGAVILLVAALPSVKRK